MALAAFAAQEEEAENGDVVVPRDSFFAGGAETAGRVPDGDVPGETEDTGV